MTETCLFFGNDVFRLGFQSVSNELQHKFAAMAYQADGAVVIAQLKVAFHRYGDDDLFCPCWRPLARLPYFIADGVEKFAHWLTAVCYQFGRHIINSSCLSAF